MEWCDPPPYLATVDPGVMEAIAAENSSIPLVQPETFPLPCPQARVLGRRRLGWRDIPMTEAAGVLGVGAGVKDRAGMTLLEQLARCLDMPLGGTKRAEDLGLITTERRIGVSGTYIAPDIYIAIGVSGASHHAAGIRKARHVVAINQDRTSPIFDIAELGIVDDFRPVVRALIDQLDSGVDSTPTAEPGV
jgi:electron transfer flavoprotein alpha subunit